MRAAGIIISMVAGATFAVREGIMDMLDLTAMATMSASDSMAMVVADTTARAAHGMSPATQVGQMRSGPDG